VEILSSYSKVIESSQGHKSGKNVSVATIWAITLEHLDLQTSCLERHWLCQYYHVHFHTTSVQ